MPSETFSDGICILRQNEHSPLPAHAVQTRTIPAAANRFICAISCR
ncbi:hypothetical protein NEICINOT_03890 [Neisseria cinerea ATCC 14685]|uniref:Uncharacterized protein n=1 Tax=Neisseria cinerea ATCC 14685 TaxID=546262 RepID=D0W2K7_NEICI|nr:hypothetical protein NEICINOT_03890 [Neisseria cinerea ATCC 14685]